MAKAPDPRRAREDAARHRAFFEGIARLADASGLREELAEVCRHLDGADDGDLDVVHRALTDPAWDQAAAAVRVVLARRGLPHQLVAWAMTLGVRGSANPASAYRYLHTHVAPSFDIEDEPLTGQRQLTLRFPIDWSETRIHEWTRFVVTRHRAAHDLGGPKMPTHHGGASIKATSAEAVSAAQRFDEQYAAQLSSGAGRRVVTLKRWLQEFDAWLASQSESQLGTAASLWKLHLRDAVRRGDFLPVTLAYRPRTRRARK
jgi:hypothetical protein